jgi:hypothetical protein
LVALSIVSIAVIVTVSLVRGSGGAQRTGASTGPSPPRVVKETWKEPPYISSVFGGKGDQDMARALNLRADRIVLSVGHDDSSGDRDAAVWTSRQRLVRWRQVRDPALRTPGEQLMSGAALLDDTVVAVGWERLSDETDAAVWTSDAAGASWGRVPGASSGLHRPADQKMHRVISPDTGLVAVGSDSASGDLDAAVWTSPDGTHWNLSDLRADGDQDAFGVTQFGQELVLVGYTTTDSDDEDAAVWVRSGDSWSSPNDPSLVDEGDQRMISVIQVGSKLVAVGTTEVDGNRDAAVWTSMNGQDWVRVPDPSGSLGGPGDQQMFAVTLVRSTLVAGGVSGLPSGGTDAAVWMSTDGTQWIREDSLDPRASVFGGPKGQQIKSIVPFEDSLVAVGSAIRERDNGAEVWYARIPSGF